MRPTVTCVGLCTLDVIQYFADRPSWGGKGVAERTLIDVGGPAANAAITVSLLGGGGALMTAIGTGPEARLARDRLEPHAVDIYDHAGEGSTVPVSSIWVESSSGDRTVLSTNQVASVVPADLTPLESGCAALVLDGHHPELARSAVRSAHSRGIPVVLDGGSWRPVFEELLPSADVAIVSGTFRPPAEEARGLDLARRIQERWGTGCVAVTDGARDVAWVEGARSGRTPVPPCRPVDTLGAGDVLHGAYAWFRFGRGWPHDRAMTEACAAASASCRYPGTREGVREYRGRSG